jgi:hypothetical protein
MFGADQSGEAGGGVIHREAVKLQRLYVNTAVCASKYR